MQPAPRKVVVGDGNAIVLALISYLLAREGYSVAAISDPEELHSIIRDGDGEILVVDAHLDGVIEAVQSCPPDRSTRIILTSPVDMSAPVYATLRKPLEFGLLIDTVRNCVVALSEAHSSS